MLKVSDKLIKNDDPEDAFCEYNQAKDYKGVFFGDDSEKKFYEAGAHFSYKDLYRRLHDLTRRLSPSRVGGERINGDITDRTLSHNNGIIS